MNVDQETEVSSTLLKGIVLGAISTGPLSTLALSCCSDFPFFSCFLGGSVVALLTGYIPALIKAHEFRKNE